MRKWRLKVRYVRVGYYVYLGVIHCRELTSLEATSPFVGRPRRDMSATYRLRPSAAGFATLRLTPLEPVSFGRVPPASQLFASPKISKQHCALSCTTDGVVTLRCACHLSRYP